jgi:hypothetical protein
VKFDVPGVVGVPVKTPVVEFRLSPAGSDPAVTIQFVYGATPPVAAKVNEYELFAVAPGTGEAVVIENGAGLMMRVKLFVDDSDVPDVESSTLTSNE